MRLLLLGPRVLSAALCCTRTGLRRLMMLWLVLGTVLLFPGLSLVHAARRPHGIALRTLKITTDAAELLSCVYDQPKSFGPLDSLHRLYGKQFDPLDKSGHGQIVVLGQHNSGTSVTTRLIMLLGAFQGNPNYISINRSNKLKYYEAVSLWNFHQAFLTKFSNLSFRPFQAQGLNLSHMTQADFDAFDCFARQHLQDLNRHPPWVMKDPRMGSFMHLWRRHINPVCVFVYKDPITNSISLASNVKKSGSRGDCTEENLGTMSSQMWLDLWSVTTEKSLLACRDLPTIVIGSSNMLRDVPGSLKYLLTMLTRAGVTGLRMPGADEIQEQVLQHLRTGPHVYKEVGNSSVIDNSVPVFNRRQKALDKALQFWMRKINETDSLDLRAGANRILQVMEEILAEESFQQH